MLGSTPHRCSCMTAPRISAWVESVSLPLAPLSTTRTRAPARASGTAVPAPAHRPPTMMTSKSLRIALPHGRDGRGDVPRQFQGVTTDAVDETRVAPALEVQPQDIQSGMSSDAAVMHD